MKNLLFLLLLPFGLWANTPASIMSPKIYELTDYIEPGQSVISMISNEGELAEFSLNPKNNFLSIRSEGQFFYAALLDQEGNLSFLYLGPETLNPKREGAVVVPSGMSPAKAGVASGAAVSGAGIITSWALGLTCIVYGVNVFDFDDGFLTGIATIMVGVAIIFYGTIASAIAGFTTGAMTAGAKTDKERRASGKRESISNQDRRGVYHVIVPFAEEEIPQELLILLLQG